LALPIDLIDSLISSERLRIPLAPNVTQNDASVEQAVIQRVTELLSEAAGEAVVLVAAGALLHHCEAEIYAFWKRLGLPFMRFLWPRQLLMKLIRRATRLTSFFGMTT
jgi:thiamine pyrophosphate-dependent acetolactate synthase large subunit-like protein